MDLLQLKNKTNEDGSENIPYMIWKGRPAEGIIVTCARAGRIVFDQTFKKKKVKRIF